MDRQISRQTYKQTHRQTHRQTDRHIDKHTDKQTDTRRQPDRHLDKHTGIQTNKHTDKQTHRYTQINTQANRQTHTETDKQTTRHTDNQTDPLCLSFVGSLTLVIDPTEVGDDDRNRKCDDEDSAERADSPDHLPHHCTRNHIAIPATRQSSSALLLRPRSERRLITSWPRIVGRSTFPTASTRTHLDVLDILRRENPIIWALSESLFVRIHFHHSLLIFVMYTDAVYHRVNR